jgi:NAD(P)-dependent dehydrogenase (short-subunit alcohol dehydrogenase family)
VNCAGVMPGGPLLDVTTDTFDLVFAVNARAPLVTMQAIAPHFIANGGGAIVNIASANAFKNEAPEGPYNASKAALVALTKAAAHEWGHHGIRANCVAPGQTVTPEEREEIARDPDEARLQRDYLRKIPLRRAGVPRDQAMAVLFLASDDAAWITGQTIIVDGGELGGGDWYDAADAPPVPE